MCSINNATVAIANPNSIMNIKVVECQRATEIYIPEYTIPQVDYVDNFIPNPAMENRDLLNFIVLGHQLLTQLYGEIEIARETLRTNYIKMREENILRQAMEPK